MSPPCAKVRPYVVVGCFVVGMVLTPPDIFSQTLLAVPMWMLFETGLLFGAWSSAAPNRKRGRNRQPRRAQRSTASRTTVNLLLLEDGDFIAADRVLLTAAASNTCMKYTAPKSATACALAA